MTQVFPSTSHRLLARLAAAQSSSRLPSITAALWRDGSVVWRGVRGSHSGVADVDPFAVQYRIGSITKTLTAILILRLVRSGQLSLNSPASDVLGNVGYADRTVRSLLAHDSGMQSEPVGSWWERSSGVSWSSLAAANDGSGAVYPPGQQFHYSNHGYALLGEIAARLNDAPWWDCVSTQILTPLGLSSFSYLPSSLGAQGYSVDPYTRVLVEEPATDTGAMAPAGQVWASIEDLASYAGFLASGDDSVLSRADLLEATHPQAASRHASLGSAHGLGFQLVTGGSGYLYGHTGSMPGFLAACFADPQRRTGVAVLTNATAGLSPGGLAVDLLGLLEECEPTVAPEWTPSVSVPSAFADALGVWHWGNTPFAFALDGDELVASSNGAESYRFGIQDGAVVGLSGYHAGERLNVVRRPDGSISHLDIATFIYTRTPYDPNAPIPGGPPAS